MNRGALMMLYVDNLTDAGDNDIIGVPDVTGMSVLEANRMLRSYGLKLRIEGSGLAKSQSPAADEKVCPSATVTVVFEPPDAAAERSQSELQGEAE